MSHRLRIMQVQLLKKLGSQRFVGQCAHSNAILRFDVALLPATLAELDTLTLTNCQFDPHTNTIKCELAGTSANANVRAQRVKRPRLDIGASV